MDELIIRHLQGDLSEIEERRLRNWRSASAENEARYQMLAEVWSLTPRGRSPGSPPMDLRDSIIAEAERRRRESGSTIRRWDRVSGRRRQRPRGSGWLRNVAAIAAGIVAVIGVMRVLPDSAPEVESPLGAEEFATGARETATITLTDGTVVRLAPNSRLRFQAGAGGRDVWLEGRGYFAVESDSSRPFTVHTRVGAATVLGTRFELRTDGPDLRLVVVEGLVALAAGGEEVEVGADEVSHVRDGGGPSVVKIDNVRELLDWPDGLLVFRSTPLELVGVELEHRFGVRLEIVEPELSARRVTGWFTDESLDEILTAICRASDVRCAVEGDLVSITDGSR